MLILHIIDKESDKNMLAQQLFHLLEWQLLWGYHLFFSKLKPSLFVYFIFSLLASRAATFSIMSFTFRFPLWLMVCVYVGLHIQFRTPVYNIYTTRQPMRYIHESWFRVWPCAAHPWPLGKTNIDFVRVGGIPNQPSELKGSYHHNLFWLI